MSLDSSAMPITNSTKEQLGGLRTKLDQQTETVRNQVQRLEELVAKYQNKATKNKDAILAEINRIKSQIQEKVTQATSTATDQLKDVTASVDIFYAKAQAMSSMFAPFLSMSLSKPDDAVKFCNTLLGYVKQIATSYATQKVDTAAAVAVVADEAKGINGNISELKTLLSKATALTNKF